MKIRISEKSGRFIKSIFLTCFKHFIWVGFTLTKATKALRESRGIALFFTSALVGVRGQRHAPAAPYPPGKTRYPLYRRLGGPQGRSGQVRKNLDHRDSIPGPSSPYAVAIPTELPGPYIYIHTHTQSYTYIYTHIHKGKGTVHPITGHEGPEGIRGIALLFL